MISKENYQQQTTRNQHFTLLELLDRLLDKGVVVKGEILLSVADIDLIYLNLGLLLSSVKTVAKAAGSDSRPESALLSYPPAAPEAFLDEPQPVTNSKDAAPAPLSKAYARSTSGHDELHISALPPAFDYQPEPFTTPKTNIDPKNVEKGLTRLVLTLVELLRKLMEKQAIHRLDAGQLSFREVERLGDTFFLLDQRMEQLKKTFGLQNEDLNLDLGPLGELL